MRGLGGLLGGIPLIDVHTRDDRYPGCGKYPRGTIKGNYSFVDKKGVRHPSTSKYLPHQSDRECARRRVRQWQEGVI